MLVMHIGRCGQGRHDWQRSKLLILKLLLQICLSRGFGEGEKEAAEHFGWWEGGVKVLPDTEWSKREDRTGRHRPIPRGCGCKGGKGGNISRMAFFWGLKSGIPHIQTSTLQTALFLSLKQYSILHFLFQLWTRLKTGWNFWRRCQLSGKGDNTKPSLRLRFHR